MLDIITVVLRVYRPLMRKQPQPRQCWLWGRQEETTSGDVVTTAAHCGSQHNISLWSVNMARTPPNHGKDWTSNDVKQLGKLADGNTPTGLIAHKMGRTEAAIRNKASEEDISLKPTNQSPYNRRKK